MTTPGTTCEPDGSWAPASCTLPTVEQPLRVRAFAELFETDVVSVNRIGPGTARLQLHPEPAVAARAAMLAMKENSCCSFFTFILTVAGGQLFLDVAVPASYTAVLDALIDRTA